ncbi:MAG: HDOD domain-containing protein [Planctomycetes bacterium]|nr:HDOD domain-containing protein [Planctomycetota bacterium]
MVDKSGRAEDARRVKLALSGLSSLAVLPSVAAEATAILFEDPFSSTQLVDLVEVSPALAVCVLSLAHDLGADVEERGFSLTQVLGRLPEDEVRTAVLSLDLYHLDTPDDVPSDCLVLPREDLVLHSLAVAVCARKIAQAMVVGTPVRLAYLAGLLHDIGKMALHQLMPLGFAGIVSQSLQEGMSSVPLEKASLGLDHGVIGKHLARRWRLPAPLQTAIWLHHSDMALVENPSGYADMARIVYCADVMVKSLQIGRSGSFDRTLDLRRLAALLSVDSSLLTEIHDNLEDAVQEKAVSLKLDMRNPFQRLSRLSIRGAARLSREKMTLSQQKAGRDRVEDQLEFFMAFLKGIREGMDAIDLVEEFARCWQRQYQTGKVLIFFESPASPGLLEAVLIDELNGAQRLLLEGDQNDEPLFRRLSRHALLPEDEEALERVWDRIGKAFSRDRSAYVVLSPEHRSGLLFELGYPQDADDLATRFAESAHLGRKVLELALSRDEQERFAEDFASLTRPETLLPRQPERRGWFNALAEMAAGFAHELNNPLSVIFGRAQLLLAAERDEERVRSLQQIADNAHEMSEMVEDLISFAEPPQPRPQKIEITQVIEEAVQLAALKSGREELAVSPTLSESVDRIYIDSGQIVSALANILVNAVESTPEEGGDVSLDVTPGASGAEVQFSIRDHGCGMDALTLEHATTPFFSAKSAGRQRGMGLAYAARVIDLNSGTLSLSSQKDQGTTVTVTLPVS